MKLSTEQTYAILYLRDQNKSISDIASELNLSTKTVKTVVDKNPKIEPEPKPQSPNGMINTTQSGKQRGVMIMTKTGSEIGEKVRNMSTSKESSCIFRPKS